MGTQATDDGIPAIARELVGDARRMVELEIEVAKAEVAATVRRLGFGTALIVGALVFVLIATVFFMGSLAKNLELLDHWWGWDVTGGALLIVAGLLGLVGYVVIRRGINGARRAASTIKGDVEWARQLPSRPASSSN